MALIQVRRGTAASAASNNPTPSAGEQTYEIDTGIYKIFDGATSYNNQAPASTPIHLVGFTPPPSTGWTNLGSPTILTSHHSRLMAEASTAGDSWRGEYRSLSPTANYTATFYFDWAIPDVAYAQAGVLLRNSGGTSLIHLGYQYGSGLILNKWASTLTLSGNYKSSVTSNLVGGMPNWLRIRDDNTNRYYEYSYNGADWILFYSGVRTDFIVPNQIGWGQNPNNAGGTYTSRARLRSFTVA
jgi:hypothetical protein